MHCAPHDFCAQFDFQYFAAMDANGQDEESGRPIKLHDAHMDADLGILSQQHD